MTKNKRLKPEYAEALLLYATTTEELKSITDRLGLRYNTVGNYMRRNYPVIISQHKALLPTEEECFAEGIILLRESNLSPYQVKEQLGYNGRFIHYIRKNFPEFHRRRVYNNGTKSRPSKIAKYAEAVAMLTEMKSRQYNVIKKVAGETGLNYDTLRMHIYTYHRELIGLDPAKNKEICSSRYAAKYAKAVALLAYSGRYPFTNSGDIRSLRW